MSFSSVLHMWPHLNRLCPLILFSVWWRQLNIWMCFSSELIPLCDLCTHHLQWSNLHVICDTLGKNFELCTIWTVPRNCCPLSWLCHLVSSYCQGYYCKLKLRLKLRLKQKLAAGHDLIDFLTICIWQLQLVKYITRHPELWKRYSRLCFNFKTCT